MRRRRVVMMVMVESSLRTASSFADVVSGNHCSSFLRWIFLSVPFFSKETEAYIKRLMLDKNWIWILLLWHFYCVLGFALHNPRIIVPTSKGGCNEIMYVVMKRSLPGIVDPLYPWISHIRIQPTVDQKYSCGATAGNLRMQRANCMYCFMSFYIRNLSIRGFWYLRGVLEPAPQEFNGMTVYSQCKLLLALFLPKVTPLVNVELAFKPQFWTQTLSLSSS